jgi:hypothetical protein
MSACVEVTLDEFDIEDVVEHVEARGFKVIEGSATEDGAELERIWAAMRLNQNEQAMELMQLYVCDKLGRLL